MPLLDGKVTKVTGDRSGSRAGYLFFFEQDMEMTP
jgi:hypothetical protein